MGFITNEGLKNLDEYKYKPGGYTMLDNIMNYYWEACVKLVPKWVAPNLLTFVGWLMVIASYANMLRYDYTFKKDLPASAFFSAAFCIFAYSTLDAIDGKQARRTQSSSPLGQLFDHGCDSFSLTFFMLGICQATKIQKQEIFLIFIVTQVAFWTSNWAQHHTGVLRTKVGQFGVTEGEYFVALVHLLTGIYGQNMWKISALDLLPSSLAHLQHFHPLVKYILTQQIGPVIIYGFAVSISFVIVYMVINTLIASKHRGQAIMEFLSIVLLTVMEMLWSGLEIYGKYNGVILVNFGIVASLLISKLIICSVTKMEFEYFHYQLIPFIVTTAFLVYCDVTDQSSQMMITAFWACFGVNLVFIFSFLYSTIRQITSYLGIECFTLKKVPRRKLE